MQQEHSVRFSGGAYANRRRIIDHGEMLRDHVRGLKVGSVTIPDDLSFDPFTAFNFFRTNALGERDELDATYRITSEQTITIERIKINGVAVRVPKPNQGAKKEPKQAKKEPKKRAKESEIEEEDEDEEEAEVEESEPREAKRRRLACAPRRDRNCRNRKEPQSDDEDEEEEPRERKPRRVVKDADRHQKRGRDHARNQDARGEDERGHKEGTRGRREYLRAKPTLERLDLALTVNIGSLLPAYDVRPGEDRYDELQAGPVNNTKRVDWMRKGIAVRKAVVRFVVSGSSWTSGPSQKHPKGSVFTKDIGVATGFVIFDGGAYLLVLTNHHVIDKLMRTKGLCVQFGYDSDGARGCSARIIQDKDFFFTCKELDFTIIKVDKPNEREYKPHVIELPTNVALTQDGEVNIIGHPKGGAKVFSIHENKTVGFTDTTLMYSTYTASGSSGSPAFNCCWELVALHRCAYKPHGNWLYNKGTPVDAIVRTLRQKASRLYDLMFATRPQPQSEPCPEGLPTTSSSSTPSPDSIRNTEAAPANATAQQETMTDAAKKPQ